MLNLNPVLMAAEETADLVDISILNSSIVAVLGYAMVFFGLILLMGVVICLSKILAPKAKKVAEPVAAQPAAPAEAVKLPTAPGTAGQLKLYNVEPKNAAMIMAIVANKMGKPLNELRFISIKEVE